MRPIRVAIGRIVRADDQARSDHDRAFRAELVLRGSFAQRFERAVVLDRELLRRCALRQDRKRGRLVPHELLVVVGGHGADEDVALRALGEIARRQPDDVRDEAARVDHRIEVPVAKAREIDGSVAHQTFDPRELLRCRLPAIEHGDVVTAPLQCLRQVAPDEDRTADDQDPHGDLPQLAWP